MRMTSQPTPPQADDKKDQEYHRTKKTKKITGGPTCLMEFRVFFSFAKPRREKVRTCKDHVQTVQVSAVELDMWYVFKQIPNIKHSLGQNWWKPQSVESSWWLNQPIRKIFSQNGNLPQIGVKIKNIWNHHLGMYLLYLFTETNKLHPTTRGFDSLLKNPRHPNNLPVSVPYHFPYKPRDSYGSATVDGRHPAPVEVGSLCYYLQGFIHPRWCRISSINSMGVVWEWTEWTWRGIFPCPVVLSLIAMMKMPRTPGMSHQKQTVSYFPSHKLWHRDPYTVYSCLLLSLYKCFLKWWYPKKGWFIMEIPI